MCMYMCMYMYMYMYMYMCMDMSVHVHVHVHMSVCLSVCQSVCLYVCLSVCLYVSFMHFFCYIHTASGRFKLLSIVPTSLLLTLQHALLCTNKCAHLHAALEAPVPSALRGCREMYEI